jgi:hypothetical protein
MKPTIDLFIGSPIEIQSEKDFLGKLSAEFLARDYPALVFANFFPLKNPHQIDFFVVTARCACHVELKRLTASIVGGLNGFWSLRRPDGSLSPLEMKNPYRQALDGKHAISDEMHAFARSDRRVPVPSAGEKFFKHFESVVCIFPEKLPGSSVFEDYKVRVRGFDGLLELLTSCEKYPPDWTRETWIAFAMHLNLVRVDDAEDRLPVAAKEARRAVIEYTTRFEAYLGQELPKLVPTTLERDTGPTAADAVKNQLLRGEHVQLIGPSGCGKTFLASHMALAALRGGRVTIIASAKEYDGKLSVLLDRSVAHLHPDTAVNLLHAADRNGSPLAFVLDGLDGCPKKWQKSLLKDLQAFYLRWRMPILITTQEPVALTKPLSGTSFRFAPLTPEERLAILRSYSPEDMGDDSLSLCEPFTTPYELSLAAECLAELDELTSRASLFDAYVRRRCEWTENPSIVRSILCAFAERMQRRLVSSLTMKEVWSVAQGILTTEGGRSQILADVLGCGLLEVGRNRCAFRHELLERFFQAEALVRLHRASGYLAGALALPRNRPLAEFVIGTEPDEPAIREYLMSLADSQVIGECIRGRLGELARGVATSECSRLLHAAELALAGLDIEIEGDEHFKRVTITRGPTWSAYDRAVMRAIGEALPECLFLDEFLRLVRQTEEACRCSLANKPSAGGRLKVSDIAWLFASLFVYKGGESAFFPVSVIYDSFRLGLTFRGGLRDLGRIVELTANLSERTHGELLLLCKILRDPDPSIAHVVPQLVRLCWDSRIYHLRLEALEFAAACATSLEGSPREEMIELLNSLPNTHVFLNTSIIDAMMAYELLEPIVSADHVAAELEEILRFPDDPEAQQRANGAVCSIFEDVYQGVSYEAIESLPRESRVRLFTMAALGAPEYSMFTDWILSRLVEFGDTSSLPAFEKWCSPPGEECFAPQDATSRYVTAAIGRAALSEEPPAWGPADPDDRRAWLVYGAILHWMFRPGLPDSDRKSACAPLWQILLRELPFEAVDPLYRFEQIVDARPGRERRVLDVLCAAFPDEMRRVLEFGMKHRERLTSLFHRSPFRERRPAFIIRCLGQVGNRDTVKVLEPLLDSPELGPDAVEVVRKLKMVGTGR